MLYCVGLARTTTVCCAVILADPSHKACGVTRKARCQSTKAQVLDLEYDPLANKQSIPINLRCTLWEHLCLQLRRHGRVGEQALIAAPGRARLGFKVPVLVLLPQPGRVVRLGIPGIVQQIRLPCSTKSTSAVLVRAASCSSQTSWS